MSALAGISQKLNNLPVCFVRYLISSMSCERLQKFFEEEVSKPMCDSVTRVLNRDGGRPGKH